MWLCARTRACAHVRERKRARTRIALVEALLPRLAERPLEDIQVAELVEAAGTRNLSAYAAELRQDPQSHHLVLYQNGNELLLSEFGEFTCKGGERAGQFPRGPEQRAAPTPLWRPPVR